MEPTSEQELKQLLEEGKITQEEYQELLEAIRQKETAVKPTDELTQPKPRNGFGKAALILMISGLLLPVVVIMITLALNVVGVRFAVAAGMPFLFLGVICLLLAFIFGIIGWKTKPGKFAAIGIPVLGISALVLVPLASIILAIAIPFVRVKRAQPEQQHELQSSYSLDSIEGVLTQDGVEFDKYISADGNGSARFFTNRPKKTVIRLFQTGPIGIDNCILIYSAQLKSELEDGRAYLEMWCDIPGKGEFFSRGLAQPITGQANWITAQTPFRLEAGQSPADVKLNLVIEGAGTVWIDDIKLLSSPLH